MTEFKIGYARVSTDAQDLTVQRDALAALGVPPDRIYVDHGLTGTNRAAWTASGSGSVPGRHPRGHQARSTRPLPPDARAIADELTARSVKLNLGGSFHDPTDPAGRLLFNVLAMIAEFEADLARMRTREGMKVAKARGRLRGTQPKLSPKQEAHLVALHRAGQRTTGELEELFSITRSTVYRAIGRSEARVASCSIGDSGVDAGELTDVGRWDAFPGWSCRDARSFAPGDTDPSSGPTTLASAMARSCAWTSRPSASPPARASSGCWVRARTGASSAPSRSTPSSGRRSRAGSRSADAGREPTLSRPSC